VNQAGPFDAMASADFLVPDRDATIEALQRSLGFGQPKPHWSHGGRGQGYRVTFCRPNPALAQSPTLVEIIAADELDPALSLATVVPNVAGLERRQANRLVKTHGMPVASSSVDDVIERVQSRGLRHWLQPSSDDYPYRRLWLGIAADDLSDYRPSGDGGLMLEVVDTETLRLPAEAFDEPLPPDPRDGAAMLRTAARVILVSDVSASLTALSETFGWEPTGPVERADDGSLRATLAFRAPRSARVELLQPATGDDAELLRRGGAGVGAVRIAVADVDAKVADLRRRGTRFTERATGFSEPERVLRVDPAATPGCLFEFVSA
jgi:hypothetical protein